MLFETQPLPQSHSLEPETSQQVPCIVCMQGHHSLLHQPWTQSHCLVRQWTARTGQPAPETPTIQSALPGCSSWPVAELLPIQRASSCGHQFSRWDQSNDCCSACQHACRFARLTILCKPSSPDSLRYVARHQTVEVVAVLSMEAIRRAHNS